MLTILFIMLVTFQAGHAKEDYGRDFVTAFPENVAHYDPSTLINYLKITALHDGTHFNVTFNLENVESGTLNSGQTKTVYLTDEVEEYRLNRSSKSVRINSDNDVTVLSYSRRGDSIQTNVVLPVDKLGNEYLIPFINFTEIILMLNNYSTSDQNSPSGSSGQSYNFFRLLIINAEETENTVTMTLQSEQGTSDADITLSPFEFIQMQSNQSLVMVTASANISVLLTHPCLDTYSCKCSMVVHQLRPTNLLGDSFIVPSFFISIYSRIALTSDQSVELKYGSPPSSGSQTLGPVNSYFLPFFWLLNSGFSNITTSGPVSLQLLHVGYLSDLMPVSRFSACYLVHATSWTKSQVLVIVQTLQASFTRFSSGNFTPTVEWSVINGTEYSWAVVELSSFRTYVIWHPFSTMAVYVVERMASDIPYGGPAISINERPDQSGCMVEPPKLNVGNQSLSWQESREYCAALGGYLVSPSCAEFQNSMALKLKEFGASGQAWIGLRRSLLTAGWYWQNGRNLDFSNWEKRPSVRGESGLCASVKMEPNGNYTWSSARCCSSLRPACYIPAHYLYVQNPFA